MSWCINYVGVHTYNTGMIINKTELIHTRFKMQIIGFSSVFISWAPYVCIQKNHTDDIKTVAEFYILASTKLR